VKALDVIAGKARWAADCSDALVWLRGLPNDSVDLLFTSPPYTDSRTYGIKADRNSSSWVEWIRILQEVEIARGSTEKEAVEQVKKRALTGTPR